MTVFNLEGREIRLKDIQVAFGTAWWGPDHPKTIEANKATREFILKKLGPISVSKTAPTLGPDGETLTWFGAVLAIKPNMADGEILFKIAAGDTRNVKIINGAIGQRVTA